MTVHVSGEKQVEEECVMSVCLSVFGHIKLMVVYSVMGKECKLNTGYPSSPKSLSDTSI